MKVITMTAEEAIHLLEDNAKVLVFIETGSVNGFDILRFNECEGMLKNGDRIQYILSDYISQIRVSSPHQRIITILLPPLLD